LKSVPALTSTSSLRRAVRFGLAVALALPVGLVAAEEKPHSVGEKTSEAFQKLKPLQDAKNWDGMIALLDSIPGVDPTSYDMALILDMKAKLNLQKEQFFKAAEPWEAAIKLSDTYHYFDKRTTLDILYFLAQIYYQEGATQKTPAIQQQFLTKSANYIARWLETTPKVTPDASMFYASLLYSLAVVNPEKPDSDYIKKAQTEVQKGLTTAIKPKEGFYVLLLATLQQQSDFVRAAEILELLTTQYPNNKTYWAQLWAIYLSLASNSEKEKNEDKTRELYARAINTIERAQAIGQLKTPKDNYTLVTIYFSAGQFGKATDLLYAGLKNGSIEGDLKNWQLLAYSYQQVNQDMRAIEVLKEAAALFPAVGQVDFSIGQIYAQLEKSKDAYQYYQSGIKKGGLEKPLNAYMSLAYVAYELEKYDDAKAAIVQAEKQPGAEKDKILPGLKNAIIEKVNEREVAREAIEGKKPAEMPAPAKKI